ncbi:G-protein coupled receptor 83-like isoform X2 [Physella acuta]|nr:G-protein coupled receptor 83-like isoform X2 [Physella acuta]
MRNRYKKKAIKMLVLVVVLFLACWSPLLVYDLVASEDINLKPSHTLMDLRFYLQCLALSSTAYNPIIYAFMNQKFRKTFLALLMKHRRMRVAPMATDKVNNAQGGQLSCLKLGNVSSRMTDSPLQQTKSSKL